MRLSKKDAGVWLFLISVFVVGFGLRYITHGPRLAASPDAWFHYRIVSYILENGHVPQVDMLSFYPQGRALWEVDQLFLPYFITYTYKFVQLFGVSLMDYMVAFPALFGALGAVPLYFLAKELLGKRVGLLAAFIYSTVPASVFHTMAGFPDKESLAGVLIFLWLYFFVKSCKSGLTDERSVFFSTLGGVFYGMSALTWGGAKFFAILIASSAVIGVLIRQERQIARSLVLMTFLGGIVMHFFQPALYPVLVFFLSFDYALLTYASLFSLSFVLPKYFQIVFNKKATPLHFICLFLAFLTIFAFTFNLQQQAVTMLSSIPHVALIEKDVVLQTVAESQRAVLFGRNGNLLDRFAHGDWFVLFGPLIVFFLAGIYFFTKFGIKYIEYPHIFILTWLVMALIATYWSSRLSFVLAPLIAMFTGYGFSFMGNQFKESRIKRVLLFFIISLTMFSTVASVVVGEKRFVENGENLLGDEWYDALLWLNENTSEDAIVISWWDYGYYIQAIAERATVVDGRHLDIGRDEDIARMLASSGDILVIDKYNPDNRPLYILVSSEDLRKARAIETIAKQNMPPLQISILELSGNISLTGEITDEALASIRKKFKFDYYYPVKEGEANIGDKTVTYYTVYLLSEGDGGSGNWLLFRLLPFSEIGYGKGLKYFKLEYSNDYVYVYRIDSKSEG